MYQEFIPFYDQVVINVRYTPVDFSVHFWIDMWVPPSFRLLQIMVLGTQVFFYGHMLSYLLGKQLGVEPLIHTVGRCVFNILRNYTTVYQSGYSKMFGSLSHLGGRPLISAKVMVLGSWDSASWQAPGSARVCLKVILSLFLCTSPLMLLLFLSQMTSKIFFFF